MINKKKHLALASERKDKRAGRKAVRLIFRLFVLSLFLLLLWQINAYFRVSYIVVDGLVELEPELVLSNSNLREGMSIILLNEENLELELKEKLPVIKSVEISRVLPDTVTLSITERKGTGYIKTGDRYLIVDSDMFCFAWTDKIESDWPVIMGLDKSSLEIGHAVKCQSKIELLADFFREWHNNSWLTIMSLDVSDSFNLIAYLSDGTEVWFGERYEMDRKLLLLEKSLPYIKSGEKTCLDIRTGNRLVVSINYLAEGRHEH